VSRAASAAFLGLGAAAVLGVGAWMVYSEPEREPPAGRPPYVLPVTLAEVERGTLRPSVRLTGTVSSADHARLGFEVGGRIAALEVREGEHVAEGAVLARLEGSEQEAALQRAQAAAERAERDLERWLAGSREEEKRRLAAELEVRKSEAELARKEVARGRELVGSRVISQSQFDTLVAESQAAEARVAAAQEELSQAEAGTRAEEIEVQRAEVALKRSEVEIARVALAKTVLAAPFAGVVSQRLAALGDSVSAGQSVYELVDLVRREIEIDVPSPYAVRLAEHARAVVALDEDPDFSLETKLDALIPVADRESRNFRGLIRLAPDQDRELALKPGLFVRVELALEPLSDVLIVPSDCVRLVQQGAIVVRAVQAAPPAEGAPAAPPAVSPGGHGGPPAGPPGDHGGPPPLIAEWVSVRVLGADAGRSAVRPLEGQLAPGDRVVLTGVDLAFPNAPLLPREPGGSPGAAGRAQ
jgi:multidrug efflux pump subunit AcrA (membrane-fusion protein)